MTSIKESNEELPLKGPIIRLQTKQLQGYFQAFVRKKFEDEEGVKCSPKIVTLLTIKDWISIFEE